MKQAISIALVTLLSSTFSQNALSQGLSSSSLSNFPKVEKKIKKSKKDSDTIYVRARKRKETESDIPMSITSFNESTISEARINSVREAADLAPNLNIVGSSSGRQITPYVRGQGNSDFTLPLDMAVTFYLDEVPLPRFSFDNDMIDVANIEVMRGAQGTLFGQNSQAGAVNITTKDPDAADGHKVVIERGNFDTTMVQATTNFKVAKNATNRLSLRFNERGEGYIRDEQLGTDLNDMQTIQFQNNFVYRPNGSSKLFLKAGAQREKGTDALYIQRNKGGELVSAQDIEPFYDKRLLTTSAKYEQDFSGLTSTTIAAFNYYDFGIRSDEADARLSGDTLTGFGLQSMINNPNALYRDIKERDRQYYLETRIQNKESSILDWTIGVNYTRTNYQVDYEIDTVSLQPVSGFGLSAERQVPLTYQQSVNLQSEQTALFGEATQELSSDFDVTVGARVLRDERGFSSNHLVTGVRGLPTGFGLDLTQNDQESSETYNDYVGRIAFNYKPTKSMQYYATVSRGYQAGGFPALQLNNLRGLADDQPAYAESSSVGYDVGVRGNFLNNRLRFHLALFETRVDDKQIRIRDDNGNSFYSNADSMIRGGEFELQAKVLPTVNFGLNAAYTKSEFLEDVRSGASNRLLLSQGSQIANVPYYTGSVFLSFNQYVKSLKGVFFSRITHKITGSRYGDDTNLIKMGTYHLWNLNIGLDRDDFGVSFYMENAFDEQYEALAQFNNAFNQEIAIPGTPRFFGIRTSVFF